MYMVFKSDGELIGMFRNDIKVKEFMRKHGADVSVGAPPEQGECREYQTNQALIITIKVCHVYSDL